MNNDINKEPEVEIEGTLVDDQVDDQVDEQRDEQAIEGIDKEFDEAEKTEILDAIDSDDIAVLRAEIVALRADLEAEEKKSSDNYELALRTKAESDNIKRRVENDVANARKFGVEKFVTEMLPVMDSLQMGITALADENITVDKFREGSEMTIKVFMSALDKFGVKEVNPEGEKFKPEFHQAMSMQEKDDVEPNTILTVFQKGYTLHGRLMRPAMVIVSKAAKPPENTSVDETV